MTSLSVPSYPWWQGLEKRDAEEALIPAPLPGDKISSFPISDKGESYKAPAASFGLTQILKEMRGVCLLELQPGP